MAVEAYTHDTRLVMTFYVGDDTDGNPIERTRSLSRVKPEADNEDLYAIAQGIASLQTYTLIDTERTDRAYLIDEEEV